MAQHRTRGVAAAPAWAVALAIWMACLGLAHAGEPILPPVRDEEPPVSDERPPMGDEEPPVRDEGPLVRDEKPVEEGMLILGYQKGISIGRVIEMIAKGLEVNFLLSDQLTGTVTMQWNRPLPKSEALDILRAILDDEGYMLVEGKYFITVKKKGPDFTPAPTEVKVLHREEALGPTEKPITALIVLDYIEAEEAYKIVGQLRDRTALIMSLPRINAIIIKDAESRVRYLMSIIEKLDVAGTAGIITIVRIQHADTGEIAETIREILDIGKPGAPPGRITPGRDPTGRVTPGAPVVPSPMGGVISQAAEIKILPDARLNSLIIVASERDTQRVLDLIKKLDTPPPADVFPIHTFQCKNQEATALAELLRAFAEKRPPIVATAAGAPPAGRGAQQESQVFFIADETTNKILVSASPLDWEVYRQLLEELDQPQPQVLVEVWIVEVSSDDQFGFGIEWQTRPPSGDARIGPSRQEIFGGTSLGLGLGDVFAGEGLNRGLNIGVRSMTNTRVTIGGKTYIIPHIDAYLKALSEINKVNVLSSPKVLTLNYEEASLDITDKIFVSTSQIAGTGADREVTETFTEEEVGIKLKFTPQINADDFVIMEIDLEVSSLIGATATEASSRPPMAIRHTINKVRVEDGNTIIITGLRRHDRTKTITRVPVLGRIPLIGLLFRSTSVIDMQTNLMIFITPHIVTDTPEMIAISEEMQGQDIELERPRFEIEPKRWRKLQRKKARERQDGKENVWQQ